MSTTEGSSVGDYFQVVEVHEDFQQRSYVVHEVRIADVGVNVRNDGKKLIRRASGQRRDQAVPCRELLDDCRHRPDISLLQHQIQCVLVPEIAFLTPFPSLFLKT